MVQVIQAAEDDDAGRKAILQYGQELSLLLPAKSKGALIVIDSVCIASF